MNKRTRDWISIGLLLLAFLLAIYRVDAQDIWGDEAWSISVSHSPLIDSLFMETNPPGYFLALRISRSLWGSSVLGIRYLSVLANVLTVCIIGRIAHTILPRSRNYALFAAALSPFLIYYAQDARMHATVLIGTSGSILAFLHLLRGNRQLGWWAIYTTCTLIAIFSHYYAFSVLFAQALIMLLWAVRKRDWHFFGRIVALWSSMGVPFVLFFIQHRRYWGNQTDLRVSEWSLSELLTLSRRALVAFGAGITISAEQQILGWIIVAVALLGAASLYRSNHQWASGTLFAVVLIGLLTAWVLTPLLPFFWERYLLGVQPAFLALVGIGLYTLANQHRLAPFPILLGVVAISTIPTWQYHTQPQYLKGAYGQTMRFISDRAQVGDLILLNGPLQGALFDYYRPDGFDGIIIDRNALQDPAATDAFFIEAVGDARRIWLVASGNPLEFDPDGKASGWLAQNGSFALHRDFPGVGLDLFVMQAPTEPQASPNINLEDEILLTGYALASDQLVAGEAVILTLFWQAQRPLDNAYTVFTHVLDSNGQLVAQADRQPQGGSRPTNSWNSAETIRDSYALVLPADLPAGDYTIHIGMYLWPDLTRLSVVPTGEDNIRLHTVTISAE